MDNLNNHETNIQTEACCDDRSQLGAATALGYEADAARFAARLITAHVKSSATTTSDSDGQPAASAGIMFDGCETSCTGFDCPSFKGVAVRELARWVTSPLAAKQPTLKARATKVLAASAAAVWYVV
jgi:hypothetical protein